MKINNSRMSAIISRVNLNYLTLLLIMIILVTVMSMRAPYFLSAANFAVMVDTFIMEAIMALGMTLVILSGGIDLTVTGILPFSSIMLALLMGSGMSFFPAAIIVVLGCSLIGFVTNLLRKTLNLHPMVVTMAIAAILKGLNLTITGGSAMSDFPDSFKAMSSMTVFGMPLSWAVYIVLAVFFIIMTKFNRNFIKVYFVGGNPEAAKLSGIKIERVYMMVYMISAALAAVAGILTAITYSSASYSYGTNADMRVITTVAIGGTSLTHGGSGSIVGTMLGTLFMAVIYDAFIMSGLSTYYQDVMTGVFLIAAVLLSEFFRYLKKKAR